jgi:hypothetical protein
VLNNARTIERFAKLSKTSAYVRLRLSDIEARFVCGACGKRGADVRPDFNFSKQPVEMMGYR